MSIQKVKTKNVGLIGIGECGRTIFEGLLQNKSVNVCCILIPKNDPISFKYQQSTYNEDHFFNKELEFIIVSG